MNVHRQHSYVWWNDAAVVVESEHFTNKSIYLKVISDCYKRALKTLLLYIVELNLEEKIIQ